MSKNHGEYWWRCVWLPLHPPPFSPVKTSKLRRNSPRHRDHSIEKFATLTEFGSNEDAPQATSLAKNSRENWNGIVQSDCSKFWRICCCGFQVRPKMALQLPKVKPNQMLGNSSCVEWIPGFSSSKNIPIEAVQQIMGKVEYVREHEVHQETNGTFQFEGETYQKLFTGKSWIPELGMLWDTSDSFKKQFHESNMIQIDLLIFTVGRSQNLSYMFTVNLPINWFTSSSKGSLLLTPVAALGSGQIIFEGVVQPHDVRLRVRVAVSSSSVEKWVDS